ncbi:4Fe-4S dicluster domain-containing protein [Candidatus Bathyarchaeota archaeon]|nr:4Fe-4S dicluster domain-containing protein [Candidatus Bathyarchaeota archaeon]
MKASANLLSDLKHVVGDQQPEYCIRCGKCSSGCPVARFQKEFRPSRIVIMTQLGMINELLNSGVFWACAECLACKERCPREVAPFDLIQALRNLAFKSKLPTPREYSAFINSILRYGIIQRPIRVRVWRKPPTKKESARKFEFRDRAALNLPEYKKPTSIEKFSEALRKALEEDF